MPMTIIILKKRDRPESLIQGIPFVIGLFRRSCVSVATNITFFNKRKSFLTILFVKLTKVKSTAYLQANRNATNFAEILTQQRILEYFQYVYDILIVYNKTSTDTDNVSQACNALHPILFKKDLTDNYVNRSFYYLYHSNATWTARGLTTHHYLNRGTGRQQCRWIVPKAVYTVIKNVPEDGRICRPKHVGLI